VAYLLKNILLVRVHIENLIVHEGNLFLFLSLVFDYELGFIVGDSVQSNSIALQLFIIEGSETAKNFNVSLPLLHYYRDCILF
jgi:hypothetical protein